MIDSPVRRLADGRVEMRIFQEILERIYEFAEEETENTESKQQSIISSSSNTDRDVAIVNLFDNHENHSDVVGGVGDDDDNRSNASSCVSEFSLTSDYIFTYPSVLPNFSANITQALRTNTIHKQWAAFINELARWVMSIKPCLREQHEYRAIGQTLYEKYPSIGTAGPKPWSFLCRSLSQRIRTERWQRRKTLAATKRRAKETKVANGKYNHLTAEIVL